MKRNINGIMYDTDEALCMAYETERNRSLIGHYDSMRKLYMTKKDDSTGRMFFFHIDNNDMGFLPFLGSERIEPCSENEAMEFVKRNAPAVFKAIWKEGSCDEADNRQSSI